MAKDELGFFSPEEVEAARLADSQLTSPLAKRLSSEASAAMQEIEDIYFGGATEVSPGVFRSRNTHSDELLAWIHSTGMSAESLQATIRGMPAGSVLVIKSRAFVKTYDNMFRETAGYIRILEKTLARAHDMEGLEVARAVFAKGYIKDLRKSWLFQILYFLKLLPNSPIVDFLK